MSNDDRRVMCRIIMVAANFPDALIQISQYYANKGDFVSGLLFSQAATNMLSQAVLEFRLCNVERCHSTVAVVPQQYAATKLRQPRDQQMVG